MTEEQAHQFVARWSRRMITWRARNEGEQVRDLSQSSLGTIGGALFVAFLALSWGKESLTWLAVESFAIFAGGFSLWMFLQLRQVKRVLYQTPEGNRK